MLREMLVSCGADLIESVKNGEDAIEAMSRQKPDIVLCDYHLGEGKDGQQVLEEAREHDFLPYSSIFVLVTAENALSMVMGVVEHEPDAYLTKPFTRDVLQTRLRRLQQKKKHFAVIARAVARREYRKAVRLCQQTADEQPRYRPELLRIQADALRRAGDYQACEALHRGVLEERELPWAQLGLAQALFAQQRLQEAAAVLHEAIAAKGNFVAAYDLLAQIQNQLGDAQACEESLNKAVDLSPKNLRRQQNLGEVALDNGHLELAEKSYRSAIQEGRYSLFGGPENYGGLARVQVQKGDAGKAGQTLRRMQNSYEHADGPTQLKMAVVQAHLQHKLADQKASQQALKQAAKLMDEHGDSLNRKDMLALAEICMASNEKDMGSQLLQKVVRANHEDEAMLEQAQALFTKAGLSQEGAELIAGEREAMIKLNNAAVQLLRDGELKQAVSMLLKAAQAMPENITINLNAVQALLQLMQADGINWRLLRQAQDLLAQMSGVASGEPRYQELMQSAQELEQQLSDAA